jgi:LDH2 family malate/lactate/ureidoglycolate dehydrogenase
MSNTTHTSQSSGRAEKIKLSVGEARSLAEEALRELSFSDEEARIIADTLINAELCDYSHLGLTRILNLAENPKIKLPREPMRIVHETDVSALIDGGNGVACFTFCRATELAITKARANGISVVGLYNSYFSGRGAYYVEMVANADLIGIHFATATPQVLPYGGARPALGTNPIAVGMPSSRGPIVFDAGMAAIMFGDIVLKARLGEALPPGVAVDGSGRPTLDAEEALKGGALPFGGHKGYVLSCCVQAMGLLAGAALARGQVQDYGFLMIVIDPKLLIPTSTFKEQLSELVDRIKSTPRQLGVDEIRFPSERAFRERKRRISANVVTLDRKIFDELRAIVDGQRRGGS